MYIYHIATLIDECSVFHFSLSLSLSLSLSPVIRILCLQVDALYTGQLPQQQIVTSSSSIVGSILAAVV